MRHTLSILVENRSGELARIVGLFSARGYNIESLTVAETLDPQISRVTLVTSGDDQTVEQITKQLNKQIRVLSVTDLTMFDHIEREMALIHVNAAGGNERQQVMHLVDIFRARVIDVSERALTIETTGDRPKVNALLGLLVPFGIHEMVRAGTLAIPRLPAASANDSLVREYAVR
ncbi:MAG TPA: acetolactate synthase small subunit [Pyrinomonadaceae bacterium]|jgi:acetolactate synthase-1/3 small subunit